MDPGTIEGFRRKLRERGDQVRRRRRSMITAA